MKLQIRVDEKTNTISEVKFKTFGCGSAIASSSYLTELVKGMNLDDAGKIKNTQIAKELCLPPVKCTFFSPRFLNGCRRVESLFHIEIIYPLTYGKFLQYIVHCSMLAEDAIKSAIKDYNSKRKTSQPTLGVAA